MSPTSALPLWTQPADTDLPSSVVAALHEAMLAQRGAPAFTAESVWSSLSFEIADCVRTRPNALGWIFRQYAKQGRIERTGATVEAQRGNAKGRRIACWRFT